MIKSISYMAVASILFTGCVGTDSDYTLKVEKPKQEKTASTIPAKKASTNKQYHQ